MDPEKQQEARVGKVSDPGQNDVALDLEKIGERKGYDLNNPSLANDHGLKTTPDGTILIPQPSSSTNDPLNWTQFRKHLILIVISCTAFLPDYGSATGAVTLKAQGA